MRRYRPQMKTIVIGVGLMILGVLCWCFFAPFRNNHALLFLLPLGILLVCAGGLELTITAFITLRKNDLLAREMMAARKAKEEEKKKKAKQGKKISEEK